MVDGILICLEERRYWYVQADGEVKGWARGIATGIGIGMDVKIFDAKSWVEQIHGPKALEILAALSDAGMPEAFRYFDARHTTIADQSCLITRMGWTGEVGFEIYTIDGTDTDAIYDRTTEVGKYIRTRRYRARPHGHAPHRGRNHEQRF